MVLGPFWCRNSKGSIFCAAICEEQQAELMGKGPTSKADYTLTSIYPKRSNLLQELSKITALLVGLCAGCTRHRGNVHGSL